APERDSGAQEEAAALVLLAQVLGGGQTSVLKRKLQFEQQVAVYSGAFHDATSLDTSSFGLIVVPDEGVSLSEAEAALDKALEEFMEEGVDQEQLDRIKLQLRASRIYESDDVEQVANRYGRALTQGLTVADVQAWPEVLQAVTAEDIMAAAERLFDPNRSVTGWLTADAPQPATDNAPAAAQTGDMTQ
ncbi:MAG: M16 family metallopeptidase, partial [Paracoccaceae bacterium]